MTSQSPQPPPEGGREEEEDRPPVLPPTTLSCLRPAARVPVVAGPRVHLRSGSGPGVSGEGPAAPPAPSSEVRRLRLGGWGGFWAASSGSMARRGMEQWPGAREVRRDGHRAQALLSGEKFLSGMSRRGRRRHVPGFENGGRLAASQSRDSPLVARKRESRPLSLPAPPGALEAGKGRGLEGTSLQICWVVLDFILFLNPKARYLFHCSFHFHQAKAQERLKIMT